MYLKACNDASRRINGSQHCIRRKVFTECHGEQLNEIKILTEQMATQLFHRLDCSLSKLSFVRPSTGARLSEAGGGREEVLLPNTH